jgi:hypothetical protein
MKGKEDNEPVRDADISRRDYFNQERAAAEDCSACGGAGKVLLLLSSKPCHACGGTGKALHAGREYPANAPATEPALADEVVSQVVERVPGQMVTTRIYDSQGRPRMLSQGFEPDRSAAVAGAVGTPSSGRASRPSRQ